MTNVLRRQEFYIKNNLTRLRERLLPLNPLGITHDEFLSLFAPEEHWPILKGAAEVADITASGGEHEASLRHHTLAMGAELVEIKFVVSADGAPLMPRNHHVLAMAPKELVGRITSWVNREIGYSYAFNRAAKLIDWLDVNCASKSQLRFIFPSIVSICELNEHTAPLADRLREFKSATSLPSIPAEVKLACRETAGLIAQTLLLEDTPDTFTAPVTLHYWQSDVTRNEGALGWINA